MERWDSLQKILLALTQLTLIGSIDFPKSFPLDLMHVLFDHVMPQLLSMWEGNFKAAMITREKNGKSKEDYVISAADWQTINTEVLKSNATTPAQLSRKVGSITARGYWNADTYAHFLIFLRPIVLKGILPECHEPTEPTDLTVLSPT
ncbi:hypothetical protein QFC22_006732 [Naganishia vaughanmartiniae]|uniref:Uncharacterized protein n=1 Tax=Naganishia vaughanmartiniae TaxID=1424756 RepID=A0ACC2WF90_9TREE|nr:hypothetical protein QFC22_006732 [Naganishia vaughanmartiniae]